MHFQKGPNCGIAILLQCVLRTGQLQHQALSLHTANCAVVSHFRALDAVVLPFVACGRGSVACDTCDFSVPAHRIFMLLEPKGYGMCTEVDSFKCC